MWSYKYFKVEDSENESETENVSKPFEWHEHTVIDNERTLKGAIGDIRESTLTSAGTLAGDEADLIQHMQNHLSTADFEQSDDDYNG